MTNQELANNIKRALLAKQYKKVSTNVMTHTIKNNEWVITFLPECITVGIFNNGKRLLTDDIPYNTNLSLERHVKQIEGFSLHSIFNKIDANGKKVKLTKEQLHAKLFGHAK